MEFLLNAISIEFYKFDKIDLQQAWANLARLSNISCRMTLAHSSLERLLPVFMSSYQAVCVEMIMSACGP
jgi:hypothetical protein